MASGEGGSCLCVYVYLSVTKAQDCLPLSMMVQCEGTHAVELCVQPFSFVFSYKES